MEDSVHNDSCSVAYAGGSEKRQDQIPTLSASPQGQCLAEVPLSLCISHIGCNVKKAKTENRVERESDACGLRCCCVVLQDRVHEHDRLFEVLQEMVNAYPNELRDEKHIHFRGRPYNQNVDGSVEGKSKTIE